MVKLGNIFCCFSSSEGSKDYKQNKSAKGNPNKGHNRSKSHSSSSSKKKPTKVAHKHTPQKNDTFKKGDITSVPLDYVNPGDQKPEDDIIKGRRHSVSVIASTQDIPTVKGNIDHENHKNIATDADEAHGKIAEVSEIEATLLSHGDPLGDMNKLIKHIPQGVHLLPPLTSKMKGRKCLVLDLDETLVHSSFNEIWNADFIIEVDVEGTIHDVYVSKRPGVDEFLKRVSEIYEVVVFTASVAKYGDPLLDRLDPNHYVHHRLFRDSCLPAFGGYVKNLAWLGRDLNDIIIIDNSPSAYSLQPFNAVPVSSWFSDIHDNELLDMLPILEDLADPAVFDVSRHLQYEW